MAELDRLTGLEGAIFIDLYGTTEAAAERIKIADTFEWSLTEEVRTEDVTIKGESESRHKIIRATYRIRCQRYCQGPAVFSREVRAYLKDNGGRIGAGDTGESGGTETTGQLAVMGTTAGVDSGAMGSGTFFGGTGVATALGSGTASNVRPPVHFAMYAAEASASGTLIGGSLDPTSGSIMVSGQGYLVRGDFSVPREDVLRDGLEILVDGPLNYAEIA